MVRETELRSRTNKDNLCDVGKRMRTGAKTTLVTRWRPRPFSLPRDHDLMPRYSSRVEGREERRIEGGPHLVCVEENRARCSRVDRYSYSGFVRGDDRRGSRRVATYCYPGDPSSALKTA